MSFEKKINQYMEETSKDFKLAICDTLIVILAILLVFNFSVLIYEVWDEFQLSGEEAVYGFIEEKFYSYNLLTYHKYEANRKIDKSNSNRVWVKLAKYTDSRVEYNMHMSEGHLQKANEHKKIMEEIEKDDLIKLKIKEIKKIYSR